MIEFISEGDLFDNDAQALVNTVNTEGVMGKGLALKFKEKFKDNYRRYRQACRRGEVQPGRMFTTVEKSLADGEKLIVNFPTKTSWRKPSQYAYIRAGLEALRQLIIDRRIASVAIPPLGAGHGRLKWPEVKALITEYLGDLDCRIDVYEPHKSRKKDRASRAKSGLTPARTMLLYLFRQQLQSGNDMTLFSAMKLSYFLCQFGASDTMRLKFEPGHYGPYAHQVTHIMYDGLQKHGYVSGYENKDTEPFLPLGLVREKIPMVDDFLARPEHARFWRITQDTDGFLEGWYDESSLEILSTVNFLMEKHKTDSADVIKRALQNWSQRKTDFLSRPEILEEAIAHCRTIRRPEVLALTPS